ncbi:MAG: hypothetical protein L3J42_02330 [Hydrogenimonas sp.]|nr:hypothetical protein [Hydrogenimonas sp.]
MEKKYIDLEVKVTIDEMKLIGEFCRDKGVNFSEWMREIALKEIKKEQKTDKDEDEDFSS